MYTSVSIDSSLIRGLDGTALLCFHSVQTQASYKWLHQINTRMESKFWKTQPVGIVSSLKDSPGIITPLDVEKIPKEPIQLPEGMYLSDVSCSDDAMMRELTDFINAHYVESSDGTFRLQYDKDFLRHYMSQGKPGWTVIIRDQETHEILGTITAVPRKIAMRGVVHKIVEVNFLCVLPGVRSKALAPLLITEITRRVNLSGIAVAIHTCGKELPMKSFATVSYFHKFLDVRRLNELGWTEYTEEQLPEVIKAHQYKKISRKPNMLSWHVLRPATRADIPLIEEMFFPDMLSSAFTEVIDSEKISWMLSCPTMQNYIVEDVNIVGKVRKPVGFVSLRSKKSLAVQKGEHMEYAYIDYVAGDYLGCMNDLFGLLQKQGKAVVNCMSMGRNKDLVRLFSFLPGTGNLHYYMYNYKMVYLPSEEMSYVIM